MKIRVSQKPLVYDHFPHCQIALSPSFSHTMVHISMSVDPKFLHVNPILGTNPSKTQAVLRVG
jgi:hypothetical protein